MEKNKISKLQFVLTAIYIFMLLITNIVTVKQIQLPFGMVATGGIIIFSITYILSDVFSEVYGYKWSRTTCHFAFILNAIMALIFQIVIWLPFPDYWVDQESFELILGNTPRVLLASFCALEVGDGINDIVFRALKSRHDGLKGFGFRAIFSSVCGNFVDSAVFMIIAFFGEMGIVDILTLAITETCLKTLYEIIILPITKLIVKKVQKKENESIAQSIA